MSIQSWRMQSSFRLMRILRTNFWKHQFWVWLFILRRSRRVHLRCRCLLDCLCRNCRWLQSWKLIHATAPYRQNIAQNTQIFLLNILKFMLLIERLSVKPSCLLKQFLIVFDSWWFTSNDIYPFSMLDVHIILVYHIHRAFILKYASSHCYLYFPM